MHEGVLIEWKRERCNVCVSALLSSVTPRQKNHPLCPKRTSMNSIFLREDKINIALKRKIFRRFVLSRDNLLYFCLFVSYTSSGTISFERYPQIKGVACR